jgi:CSLREA domain-containing protein
MARREAAEQRRETLRLRRAGVVLGAAAGASALFAGGAQAATFEVNSLADGPAGACDPTDCTLRDAITLANGNADTDTITFQSGLSGTITLTQGELPVSSGPVVINGPGAGALSVSGDADSSGGPSAGDSRVFNVNNFGASLSVSGLTLTGGSVNGNGGAITALGDVTLSQSTVTGNQASNNGGGVYQAAGRLTVTQSTISGNTAAASGGGIAQGTASAGKYNTVAGNVALTDTVVSGNTAVSGGGLAFESGGKYADSQNTIARSTVSGNTATGTAGGGGIAAANLSQPLRLDRSAVTGNTADAAAFGGGVLLQGTTRAEFELSESTVSGNTAGSGAGISIGVGTSGGAAVYGAGELSVHNSTVAGNTAAVAGGGIHLASYASSDPTPVQISTTLPLASTVVADNTAAGVPNDLDRADDSTAGGADLSFSLVEVPGDAAVTSSADAPSIVGKDPQLGALANNGGPTQTILPASTSVLIDQGHSPADPGTDQRGEKRVVDTGIANPAGGDGTDIGAVELAASQVTVPSTPAPAPQTPVPTTTAATPRCEGVEATIVAVAGKRTVGTSGRDVIVGTNGADEIDGGGGNDLICGAGGNDRISGGTGKDKLYGETGNDRLSGQDGADKLYGESGKDSLSGGNGNDRLSGGSSADKLSGGAGNDVLYGGSGNDTLRGGSGKDRFIGGAGKDKPNSRKPS